MHPENHLGRKDYLNTVQHRCNSENLVAVFINDKVTRPERVLTTGPSHAFETTLSLDAPTGKPSNGTNSQANVMYTPESAKTLIGHPTLARPTGDASIQITRPATGNVKYFFDYRD